jgi:hypothetical protein
MRQSELTTKLTEMDAAISVIVEDVKRDFSNSFKSDSTDNERVNLESDAHYAMVDHLISSRINSKFKKAYDNSKINLDVAADEMDLDPRSKPEETTHIFTINGLIFNKRQNKDGTSTLLTDFVNSLNRCGVDKETIDKALKMAEKPKRGNVYYIVATEA